MVEMKIDEIVRLKPENLRELIRTTLTKQVHENFNWLGLAETLAFETGESEDLDRKILFAELAVTIYEWLADHGNSDHSDSNINSAIAIKIYMLSNKYVDSFHPTMGIDQIIRRVEECIDFSPQEALKISKSFRNKLESGYNQVPASELEKLKRLRKIKNKLSLIKNLPFDELSKRVDFKAWLEIYSALP